MTDLRRTADALYNLIGLSRYIRNETEKGLSGDSRKVFLDITGDLDASVCLAINRLHMLASIVNKANASRNEYQSGPDVLLGCREGCDE